MEKMANVNGLMISDAGNYEAEILKELRNRHGIHLFRLSTPLPTLKTNTYFAENPVPTLIDVPADNPLFLTELDCALGTLGYSINDVRDIIVTHPHSDHCGSARTISEKSGAVVRATKETAVRMENFEEDCYEEEKFTVASLMAAGVPGTYIKHAVKFFRSIADYTRNVEAVNCLEEHELVPFSSFCLSIKRVPGHTPWCTMLLDGSSGFAFTGDFLLKDISPNPIMQRPDKVAPGYRRLETFITSLQRVREMKLRCVLPGHGPLIQNPSERISELLRFIEKRRKIVMESFSRSFMQTPFNLAENIFPGLSPEQSFLAISEVTAYLELLQDEGIIMRIDDLPLRYKLI